MILATLLLAATLHPGPERAVQASPRDAQPYPQRLRGIAAGDETALVLFDYQPEVRAVRVDRDGKTLDTVPLTIAIEAWGQASVARGTDEWLVAWSNFNGIQARTAGDDGTLGAPFDVTSEVPSSPVSVAFDEESYLLVWAGTAKIHGVRVRADGVVLESPFEIAASENRHIASLFPDPAGGFVLVAGLQGIDVLRLDSKGRLVSSRRAATPSDLGHVIAGLDAAGQLVLVWRDGHVVYAQRGDAAPVLLAAGSETSFPTPRAVVVASGATYALYQHDGDVVLKDLDSGAEKVWDVAYTTLNSDAVSFGDRVLVAASIHPPPGQHWSEELGDVYVATVDAALADVAPVRLLYAEPRMQIHPAIADDAVVWVESVDEERRKQIVLKIGDGRPIAIADDVSYGTSPQVASSGDGFLVTWHDAQLYPWARRVRRDGTLGEPQQLSDRMVAGSPCVAWTGSEYVTGFPIRKVAYRWYIQTEVWMQALSREGVLSGTPAALSGQGRYLGVACAASKTATLFVWSGEGVTGAVRTHTGAVSTGIGIGTGFNSSVASNGNGFLVTWSSQRAAVSDGGTVGTRIETPGDFTVVGARGDGYVLLTQSSGTLTATPLDAEGETSGEPVVLAHHTTHPALAGSTVVYQRDTAELVQPRWRVFRRTLSEVLRRRPLR